MRSSLNDGALLSLEQVPENGVVEVEASVDGDAESVLLCRTGDVVQAWLNVCPHAGRRLDWAPGKFLVGKDGNLICAAHGAAFRLSDGECVSGPCRGDSLRAVAVTVHDGYVWPPVS